MLAILAAVTDVIKQNDGVESDTEYYAALVKIEIYFFKLINFINFIKRYSIYF